jgi:hypothetical protein
MIKIEIFEEIESPPTVFVSEIHSVEAWIITDAWGRYNHAIGVTTDIPHTYCIPHNGRIEISVVAEERLRNPEDSTMNQYSICGWSNGKLLRVTSTAIVEEFNRLKIYAPEYLMRVIRNGRLNIPTEPPVEVTTKKFHLFSGARYYPGGGASDYRGSFDTMEAAKSGFTPDICCQDWANIMETQPDGSLRLVGATELDWDSNVFTWEIAEDIRSKS